MDYTLYFIHTTKKKQFKVQIIGILVEIYSFIDQKCTSKRTAKERP